MNRKPKLSIIYLYKGSEKPAMRVLNMYKIDWWVSDVAVFAINVRAKDWMRALRLLQKLGMALP